MKKRDLEILEARSRVDLDQAFKLIDRYSWPIIFSVKWFESFQVDLATNTVLTGVKKDFKSAPASKTARVSMDLGPPVGLQLTVNKIKAIGCVLTLPPLSLWNPEGCDRRRVESLDEDGEKGKKRGDIPRSFLLVVFLVFLSREEDIFSSMTHNCLIHEDNLRKEREIRFSEEKILLLKLYINWFFWKRDIVIFLTLVTTIEIEFVDRYHEMRDMTVEFSLSWIIPQRWSIWISCKQALLRLLSIHVFATVHSTYGNESLSEISVSTWKSWHCLYIYFKQIVFIYIYMKQIFRLLSI